MSMERSFMKMAAGVIPTAITFNFSLFIFHCEAQIFERSRKLAVTFMSALG